MNGLITKTSVHDFDTTYNKLRDLIQNNPNLKIMLELDHSANAVKKDLELRPTRIILFGNPNLGTPLMQAAQTVAIDLPQKVLVYTDADGTVKVSYNDPAYLQNRHQIDGKDEVLTKISGALDKITSGAVVE